jgi:DNA modification methylase
MPDTTANYRVICGDCLAILPTLPAASFDVVFTDPPYPCIKRPYGTWTEAEWFTLIRAVVPEVRRVLKPSGSAVFVLQPNERRAGNMYTWLWEFLAWVGREWNVVQDAYWWNYTTMPRGSCTRKGTLRPSVKQCVWCGPPDCYRNQDAVLWAESDDGQARRLGGRCRDGVRPSSWRPNSKPRVTQGTAFHAAVVRRGGVTPFNLLPIQTDGKDGKNRHPGKTPLALCSWWLRYLCLPGGAVLDPFCGSATTGVAALRHGASFTGIESVAEYVDIARKRLDAEVCQSA